MALRFSVPLGTYHEASSPLHSFDASLKLPLLLCYVLALFLVQDWMGLGLCALILLGAYLLAKIPLSYILRGCKVLLVILVFLLLVNSLTFHADPSSAPGATPGPSWEQIALIGSFGLKPKGALFGLYLIVRIIALVSSVSLLTYCTSALELRDGLIKVLNPFAKIKLPVEDIALSLSIILRFIPLCASQAESIAQTQLTRGSKLNSPHLIPRIKAWIPLLIPLLVSLFRQADNLACSMESRCYTGKNRTHLVQQHVKASQVAACILCCLALIALGICL